MRGLKPTGGHPSDPSDLPASLALASPGSEVVVERILLELVRTNCYDLGISVGNRLRVEERMKGEVVVRNGTSHEIRLASPYAFYVQVDYVNGGDGKEATNGQF